MDEKRIFSEKEAADLIVQAAKLQEASSDSGKYVAGVTWEELKRMADDVGVDPSFLRQAMSAASGSIEKNGTKRGRYFLGMPLSEEFEMVVDAEIAPENFDVIAGEFYNPGYGGGTAGAGGASWGPSVVGRMIKGQFYEGLLLGTMEVSSRHGRTRIKAVTSNAIATMAIYFPIMLMWFLIAMGVGLKGNGANFIPMMASFGVGAVGLWAVLGGVLKNAMKRIPGRLERIADAIRSEAELNRESLAASSPGSTVETEELRENLRRD